MDKFRLTECQTLDIPVGNDVPLLVKLVKGFDGCDGEGVVPFPIDVCENVVVTMVSERGQVKSVVHRLGTDGEVLLELQAGDFRAGLTYGIDVRATLNGKAVHAYGKSLVRITAATERGPRQVAQAADPYEVTLQVGYVGDLIPRRLDELEGYDDLMAEVGGKADAEEVGEALAAVGREFQKYIPLAQKAAAGGVAELDANRKVFNNQLYFAPRGTTTAAAMDGELEAGLYLVNGFKVSDDVLDGDGANGFLLQGTGASRGQLLVVGRAASGDERELTEVYSRCYLPTPKRWTAWSKPAGGGGEPVIYDVIYNENGDYYYTETECYDEYEQYRKQNIPVFFRIVSGSCPADVNKLISLCSNDDYFFLSYKQYGTLLYDWVFLKSEYFGVDNKRILLTRKDINQILPIRFLKSGNTVNLNWRDKTITSFTDANTTYKAMTAAQATAGTATTGLLISPKVLADYITDRIRSSISHHYLIEINEIGQNQYEVDDTGIVEEAFVGLNEGGVLKCQVEVKMPGNYIFPLGYINGQTLYFSYANAEEYMIQEVQINRNSVTGDCTVDYFIRVIPSE